MSTAIAVLVDGPLSGTRREVQTDYYGRVPDRVEITTGLGNTHVYVLDRSRYRAREWAYRYQREQDATPR